ncbi:glutaminyl-peptide cyclotransferase-like [Heracleum sosnowskyi]|uniref:Glutaminyl-peptide cyclotransferase-like n=1 Tax=Heracleum sosnowskyi TaxID=360622 RepID=A0AAD8HIC4_9APIA|nr:glutaminyl-peptide cyclotransferase-like [Heracleum sosnowskyi]
MASGGKRRKSIKPPPPKHKSNLTHSVTTSTPPSIYTSFKKHLYFIPLIIILLAALFLSSISSNTFRAIGSRNTPKQNYVIEVVNEFPHDPAAFTQGLLYGGNDTMYESTGLYHQSSVRRVEIQTGKILALHKMDSTYFGEGLTLFKDRLYQVTWLKKIGFIYDRNDFSKFQRFTHQMEDGWGLATDGKVLFGTDGSSTLYHIDPQNMKVLQKQLVTYNGHEVHNLNELEYINDEVWANVLQTDCIARISPKDGVVREWILLHSLREGLLAAGRNNFDVLNGIAWDKDTNRIFVTGKLWPKLYEIKLHPARKQLHVNIRDVCMPGRFQF